jgi:hypothetical protein
MILNPQDEDQIGPVKLAGANLAFMVVLEKIKYAEDALSSVTSCMSDPFARRHNGSRSVCLLVLILVVYVLAGTVLVGAVGTVDQAWAPSGSPSGGDAIKYHAPIGQSFKPTMDNLVGVDIDVLNNPVLDAAETTYVGGNSIDFHSPIGQSFTPTYAIFAGFDVYLMNSAPASRAVTMNLRSGAIGGPIVASKGFSVAGSASWGWIHVDMSSPVSINPGSLYVIELVEPVGGTSWGCNSPGTYAGGNAIYMGADNAAFDNMFRTFGATDRLTVNVRAGSIGGAVVGTATMFISLIPSFSWVHVDFTQFSITPGATYVIEVIDPQGSASWAISIPGGYADGDAIVSGAPTTGDNWFRTYGVAAIFDFSISLTSSSSATVTQGDTASWGVQVTLASGTTQSVTLTIVGTLPAGATPNTPITNSPSFSSTVSIATSASTPVGTYPLTIQASSASVSHSVPITLVVNPIPPSPDFAISSSSMNIPVIQGSSGGSTITVTSLNGFNAAVALSPSWVGSAPSDVTFTLPTPVTPPSGSTANSPLTVTAGNTASTGSYTLRVTGTSGSLTHLVDISVQITAAATTTGTTTPTTEATTATAASSTTTSEGPKCLIATATYGSELSPEVQFLRNFRDNSIMKSQAGSNFMIAFNAWYYPWSPAVADYLTTHWIERTMIKGAFYPLVGILKLSSLTYSAAGNNPEFAVVLSGLVASSLIGAFYLGLPIGLIRAKVRRMRPFEAEKFPEKMLGVCLIIGVVAILLGEILLSPVVLMVASVMVVLSTLSLSAVVTSTRIAKIANQRYKSMR